jgi:hypothetical protein
MRGGSVDVEHPRDDRGDGPSLCARQSLDTQNGLALPVASNVDLKEPNEIDLDHPAFAVSAAYRQRQTPTRCAAIRPVACIDQPEVVFVWVANEIGSINPFRFDFRPAKGMLDVVDDLPHSFSGRIKRRAGLQGRWFK